MCVCTRVCVLLRVGGWVGGAIQLRERARVFAHCSAAVVVIGKPWLLLYSHMRCNHAIFKA